ncbi:MAG: hypothetical protein GX145_03455 [Clostridiaceae bacterium]|jgi:cell division protein FtsB|nr:hypothetical protein [Bacillota bacterium]NLN51853.1 hypothetical protein [Clostridiaceae bacterium]
MSSPGYFSYSKQERQYKKRTERNIIGKIVLGLIFVISLAIAFSIIVDQNREMERLKIKERDLQIELDLAEMEQAEIQELKTKIGTNEFIERIARDELGLVTSEEYIFIDD